MHVECNYVVEGITNVQVCNVVNVPLLEDLGAMIFEKKHLIVYQFMYHFI